MINYIIELGLTPVFRYMDGIQSGLAIVGDVRENTEQGDFKFCEAKLPVGVWNRGAIISAIVRMRYSADDVEAIVNNVLADPLNPARMDEYQALQQWRRTAKEYATELMAYADEQGISDMGFIPEDGGHEPARADNIPDGIVQMSQALTLAKSQALELDDARAIEVPALFPTWESRIGAAVEAGERLFHKGRLWKVLQDHMAQADWMPDTTPSLFAEVAADQEQGTIDNPIPYNGNMALEEGKYYTQGGVVYLCIRDTVNPVYNDLSALVGLYVQVVE